MPYQAELIEPYTRAALAEVDLWADAVGPAEATSVYVGGGTPTLALDAVSAVLDRMRERFRLTGDVCIETNPADVDERTVAQLHDAGVALVSLGVQSFRPESLKVIGRRYTPEVAEKALSLLADSDFASVNADIMFALPGQSAADVIADLEHAAELGADQLTTYPLFTFPYTAVGEYLHLAGVRLPDLRTRHEHYRAISEWCEGNGYERVSVWGFKRGEVPRYSSVTRDGYIGIGPGSGSHLPDGFTLNTFDLDEWERAWPRAAAHRPADALRGRDERLVVAVLALLRHADPDDRARRSAGRRRRQGAALAQGDHGCGACRASQRDARAHRRRARSGSTSRRTTSRSPT